jgi:DNA-binding transcriptional ArsR family regulator
MPTDDQDFIVLSQPATISFALEPVRNMLNSLCLLYQVDELSGLDAWVTRTAAALTSEQLHTNHVTCEGLYFAIQPDRAWPSFPAYLDGLAAQDALVLRDRLLRAYDRQAHRKARERGEPAPSFDWEELPADVETFLTYLQASFGASHINIGIETEAYALLKNPPAMQDFVVSHLRDMWDEFLAVEWERVRPMLQDSVDAFQQLDFTGRTAVDVACMIDPTLGEELEKWGEHIARARQVIFVPSAHIGPYVRKFGGEGVFGIFFGARLPEGTQVSSPALTRSELMVRLGALADDTRLGILDLLAQHDELCAKDIMTHLDLSQSAASRHLRQLSATGYVTERRQEGAKCYRLNRDRFRSTLRAMEQFLELT